MKKILLSLVTLGMITACGGGDSGGNGAGTPTLTHNELARLFIDELNLNSTTTFDLVKSSTEQFNYVVIYDVASDSYDAVNIGTFVPGSDPLAYLDANRNYVDLDVIPSVTITDSYYDSFCDCTQTSTTTIPTKYRDRRADITFEKTAPTPKDRLALAALEETVQIKKAAGVLSAKFGMSQERALEVGELAVIWKNAPKDRMTVADHDEFATNILGHSITEYQAAVEAQMSGDASQLNDLIASTAEVNGLTPEKANQIVKGLFGVELN